MRWKIAKKIAKLATIILCLTSRSKIIVPVPPPRVGFQTNGIIFMIPGKFRPQVQKTSVSIPPDLFTGKAENKCM